MSCGGPESWTFGDKLRLPPAPATWKDAFQMSPPTLFLPDPLSPLPEPLPCGPLRSSLLPSALSSGPTQELVTVETLDYGQLAQGSNKLKFKGASWSSNCFADKGEPQGVPGGGAPSPLPSPIPCPASTPNCFMAASSRIFGASICGRFYTANLISQSQSSVTHLCRVFEAT